jgi:hypothetical protein
MGLPRGASRQRRAIFEETSLLTSVRLYALARAPSLRAEVRTAAHLARRHRL